MDTPIDPAQLALSATRVQRLARALVSDEHAAEDLAQEAALRALERPPAESGALGGWMRSVVRNLAMNRARASSRRRAREEQVARPDLAGDGSDGSLEAARDVVDAVLALREPYRSTVRLRFFEGLSPREIAGRLDVPVKTVQMRLHRALAELRTRLDARHGGDRGAWCAALLPIAFPRQGVLATLGGSAALVGGILVTKPLASLVVAALVAFAAWSLGGDSTLFTPEAAAPALSPRPIVMIGEDTSEVRRGEVEKTAPRIVVSPEPAAAVETGSLVGEFLWPDGSPAADVTVHYFSFSDRTLRREYVAAQTDAAGLATWTELAAGEGVVVGDRGGSWRLAIEAGEELRQRFVFDAGETVSGRVVDHEGYPVEGAGIWRIEEHRCALLATSGAGGYFRIEAVSENIKFGARAVGHGPSAQLYAHGLPHDDRGERTVDIPLTAPGGSVAGRVVDPDGSPVVGAQVKVGAKGGHSIDVTQTLRGRSPSPVIVRTDDAGEFVYANDLEFGDRPVEVLAAGFPTWSGEVVVSPGRDGWVEVVLEQPGRVVGRVLSPTGEPVAGATVVAAVERNGGWYWNAFPAPETSTDEEGRYELQLVAGGAQEINARGPRYSRSGRAQTWTHVAPGKVVEHDITLEIGHTIRGRVIDGNGEPISGLVVGSRSRLQPAYPRQDQTDEHGEFLLANLADVAVELRVHDPARWTVEPLAFLESVRPNGDAVEIVVDDATRPSGTLVGRVVNADGSVPTDIDLVADREGATMSPYVSFDPDTGEFAHSPIGAGRWRIVASRSFHMLAVGEWVDVGHGETVDVGVVELRELGGLEIEVVGLTEEQLEELRPRVDRRGSSTEELRRRENVFWTDALVEGTYRATFGGERLRIPAPNGAIGVAFLPTLDVEIVSGEVTRLAVEPEPAGRVAVIARHAAELGAEPFSYEVRDASGRLLESRRYGRGEPQASTHVTLFLPVGTHELALTLGDVTVRSPITVSDVSVPEMVTLDVP